MLIVSGPSGAHEHRGPAFHPERPERVQAVAEGLDDLHLGEDRVEVPAPEASLEDLARVHTPAYLSELEAFCRAGGGDLDPDTYAAADSWEAARRSAGGGLAAVAALRARGAGVGFVATRPPGHHAERARGMGFCLLNNVAVTAAALRDGGERVAIVDWDVHHGNGTQEIFWDDPDVLYVSTHQWPLYPGTGSAFEVGGPGAPGLTVNVPVPAGATGDVLRLALESVAGPVVEQFAPDWVLVSCGFDAHRDDPLAGLALSSADFARLALLVQGFVPAPGRLVLFLEGGYDRDALRRTTTSTLGALLGQAPDWAAEETSGGPGEAQVLAVTEIRARAVARLQESGPA